jgi:integrase
MLRKRQEKYPGTAVVFPAPMGSLRDPSNTASDLRRALDKVGFDWVTSHMFRKTVATLMDEGGLSSRAAADQLGHANPSMTQDVYMGRKVASTGAAAILEVLG